MTIEGPKRLKRGGTISHQIFAQRIVLLTVFLIAPHGPTHGKVAFPRNERYNDEK